MLVTGVWQSVSQSMSTYQRVTRETDFDCMSGSWSVCEYSCACIYVCVCVPVAVAGVEQKKLSLCLQTVAGLYAQDSADGGSAGGCWGG